MRFSTLASSLGALAVLAFAIPATASPTVIDFSGTPAGIFSSYTESGVTFTATDGRGLTSDAFGPTPGGSRGLVGEGFAQDPNGAFSTIRADIFGGTSFVSIDLGDNNGDPDELFLELYDSLDNLLASATLQVDFTDASMHTLTASSAGIAYAIFGSRAPSLNGESNIYADNFTFDAAPTQDVPEPGTLAMLAGAGVVGLSIIRRRK